MGIMFTFMRRQFVPNSGRRVKRTPDIPPITINDRQTEHMNCTRLLGVTLSHDLAWQRHIKEITAKTSRRVYFIILLKREGVETYSLVNTCATIIPLGHQVRLLGVAYEPNLLENIQKRAMRIYFVACVARLPTLADRRETQCRILYTGTQQPNHKLHHLPPE